LASCEAAESNTWSHGSYAVASTNNVITIRTPKDTEIGDTLFLFLSRTDDFLPMDLDQWTRGAACYKSNNKQRDCFRASDCIAQDGSYCRTFDRDSNGSSGTKYTYSGSGQDLATVMFYRKVTASTPASWGLTLWGKNPTWAIITAIPNVRDQDPIDKTIGVARTSCDNQAASVYPSVYGGEGDILFLSQAFDDTASSSDFTTPDGTTRLGWIRSSDEVSIVLVIIRHPITKLKHSTNMLDYAHSRPDFYSAKGLAVQDRLDNSFQALDLAVEVSVRMRCYR